MGRLVALGPPKRCPKCKETKPRSEFYAQRQNGGVYAKAYCIPCDTKRSAERMRHRGITIRNEPKAHARRRVYKREWTRAKKGTPVEHYRTEAQLTDRMWRAVRAEDWQLYDTLRAEWFLLRDANALPDVLPEAA